MPAVSKTAIKRSMRQRLTRKSIAPSRAPPSVKARSPYKPPSQRLEQEFAELERKERLISNMRALSLNPKAKIPEASKSEELQNYIIQTHLADILKHGSQPGPTLPPRKQWPPGSNTDFYVDLGVMTPSPKSAKKRIATVNRTPYEPTPGSVKATPRTSAIATPSAIGAIYSSGRATTTSKRRLSRRRGSLKQPVFNNA